GATPPAAHPLHRLRSGSASAPGGVRRRGAAAPRHRSSPGSLRVLEIVSSLSWVHSSQPGWGPTTDRARTSLVQSPDNPPTLRSRVLKTPVTGSFAVQLKGLREAAGFTQEELATIAGLSVHAISSLERGQRRRPHLDTLRALSSALDLTGGARDALFVSARATSNDTVVEELIDTVLPVSPTRLIGRDEEVQTLQGWLAQASMRLITLTGPG